MAYFVTGATGFIGRYLVANLLRRGEPVYVLVRKSSLKKLAAQREEWGADDKQVIAVGTIPELLATDHPWIQEYFNGPRGRAAKSSLDRAKAMDKPMNGKA